MSDQDDEHETTILPPLVSVLEPYIDQAAEARARRSIRKSELPSARPSQVKPFAPTAIVPVSPARSPRATYREDINNEPSIKSSATPGRPSRTPVPYTVKPKSSPETRLELFPPDHFHDPPSARKTIATTGAANPFEQALETIAALKMHEFIVNRKSKTNPRHRVRLRIC